MLNGRLYRVAFVPFLLALAVAAFSLTGRPPALSSTLAPDAFNGARAFADLGSLATQYPDRRPGSAGDDALATHVAHTFEGLGGTAGGGFSVRTLHSAGQTIDGERQLTTVIAQRPGSTNDAPIVILAHRDAAARGSKAELSGTAGLLELARVFATRATKRSIILVSSSGGSGGDAGAAKLSGELHGPMDAAIVLGDLAGAHARRPFMVPYSDGYGSASLQLQRTLGDAITHEAGTAPGAPSVLGQLAHLAFPFAVGEQGVLEAHGIPSVLVQVSSERGPSATAPVSAERLEGFGRSVLSAVGALDAAPDISSAPQKGVLLQRQLAPSWAVRLLVLTLLLAPLLLAIDGLARLRRRRVAVGRWTLWTLSTALPFLAGAVFAYLLGLLGIIAAPQVPVPPGAMPFGLAAAAAVIAVGLVFALAWLLWGRLVRRLHWGVHPDPDVAGLPMLLVLLTVSLILWIVNPYTALLLVPALHLWLLVVSPELRPRRLGSLGLLALGLAPLLLLVSFYADQLALGPGETAWTGVLLLAGGHLGFAQAILWSLALGCAVTAGMLAFSSDRPPATGDVDDDVEITIRGPLSYAGPGSLGGTESALRR
jgi:hypothetical protein